MAMTRQGDAMKVREERKERWTGQCKEEEER